MAVVEARCLTGALTGAVTEKFDLEPEFQAVQAAAGARKSEQEAQGP